MPAEDEKPTIRKSAQEYGRGILGGLLFSVPLLFTREVWYAGFLAEPARLAAGLAFTFALLIGFNRFAGLRSNATWGEVVLDSIEEYGLGLVIAALVFWANGRFGPGVGFDEAFGLVVVGSLCTSLGVSVGTAQLGENPESEGPEGSLLGQIVVGLCGATIVAANIAPTQEVLTVAVESTPLALGGLLVLTLLLLSLAASFAGLKVKTAMVEDPPIPAALFAPATVYGVAFVASAAFLAFFGRFDGNDLATNLRQLLVLSAPAAIGASVGRALVQA